MGHNNHRELGSGVVAGPREDDCYPRLGPQTLGADFIEEGAFAPSLMMGLLCTVLAHQRKQKITGRVHILTLAQLEGCFLSLVPSSSSNGS